MESDHKKIKKNPIFHYSNWNKQKILILFTNLKHIFLNKSISIYQYLNENFIFEMFFCSYFILILNVN